MQTWWEYRQWVFQRDMNGDGLPTTSDIPLWGEWLYFLPGDAFIAQFGATPVGAFLELSPGSFGSMTSAALSAAGWLIALCLLFYLPRFFVDIVDPTSRQQRRERRAAQRWRKSERRRARREAAARPPRLEERREPHF